MLYLDTRLRLIKYEELFRGTVDLASVYPREIAKRVLALNAAAVLLAHNHPSGISGASDADRGITRKTERALRMIDVRVIDHLIVAPGAEPISFAEHGWV